MTQSELMTTMMTAVQDRWIAHMANLLRRSGEKKSLAWCTQIMAESDAFLREPDGVADYEKGVYLLAAIGMCDVLRSALPAWDETKEAQDDGNETA